MNQRDKDINTIVDGVRGDLKLETRCALMKCTDDEIQGIIEKHDAVICMEIERVFIKMSLQGRIEEKNIPGWEIKESGVYELSREKYMPGIRNSKIDKLIDD